MIRRLALALAAVLALSIPMLPSSALAFRGGGHFGGWHGGWHGGGFRGGWGWGPRIGLGVGLGLGLGYYGAYPYGYSCWRPVPVATPYGTRWHRVWVCG